MEVVETDEQTSQGKRQIEEEFSSGPVRKCMKDSTNYETYPELTSGITNVPYKPISKFYGREEEMDKLKSAVESKTDDNSVNIAITGLAGIGKTELLLQFIKNNPSKYKNIIWIPSSNEFNMENVIVRLAKLLKIVNTNYKVLDSTSLIFLIQKLYKAFGNTSTLVVFDNALVNINKYLPPLGVDRSNITFIVTSQYKEWQCDHHINVNCFTLEQSMHYVEDNVAPLTSLEKERLPSVCLLMGNNPLGLKILASYCREMQKILQNVTSIFSPLLRTGIENLDELTNLLEYKKESLSSTDQNKECLATLFKATLNALEKYGKVGYTAKKLLVYLSFMKCENIEACMFNGVLGSVANKNNIIEAMLILEKYSLLTIDDSKISISQLTQLIFRNSLNPKDLVKKLTELLTCFEQCYDFRVIRYEYRAHILNIHKKYASFNKDLCTRFQQLFLDGAVLGETKDVVVERICNMYERLPCKYTNLKLQHNYLRVLDYNEGYDEILEHTDTIISHVPITELEKSYDGLMILYYRAHVLYIKKQYEEAFTLCSNTVKLICLYNITNEGSPYDSLKLLCQIACELDQDGNSKYFKLCLDTIEKMSIDHYWLINTYVNMKSVGVIRKHLVKLDQTAKAVEFIKKIQERVEDKFEKIEEIEELDSSERGNIKVYLLYQMLKCFMASNDIQNAWDTIHELRSSFIGIYEEKIHLKTVKLIFQIATKLNPQYDPDHLLQTLTSTLTEIFCNCYCSSDIPEFKIINECLDVVEKEFCQEFVCKFYTYSYSFLKGEEKYRLMVREATYLVKQNNVDKAWEIYENICVNNNKEVGNKPIKLEDLLEIFNDLEKSLK